MNTENIMSSFFHSECLMNYNFVWYKTNACKYFTLVYFTNKTSLFDFVNFNLWINVAKNVHLKLINILNKRDFIVIIHYKYFSVRNSFFTINYIRSGFFFSIIVYVLKWNIIKFAFMHENNFCLIWYAISFNETFEFN